MAASDLEDKDYHKHWTNEGSERGGFG